MTEGLPWVKDDDSKDIPAVLQLSKSLKQVDAFKELAQAEKDEKYKAWDKSKGETEIEEKVGDPLAIKLYKSVVLKQKETRDTIRNVGSSERSKIITLRNKTAKEGVKSQWWLDNAIYDWRDIFSDWNEPGTTHELLVRYFSQLYEDFLEVLNTEGVDKAKTYELYQKIFLEFLDYFAGKTDKVPPVVKRKDLVEAHGYERPKPMKSKPKPVLIPVKEEVKGRYEKNKEEDAGIHIGFNEAMKKYLSSK